MKTTISPLAILAMLLWGSTGLAEVGDPMNATTTVEASATPETATPPSAPEVAGDELLAQIPRIFSETADRYKRLLESLKASDPAKLPRSTNGDDVVTVIPEDWTSGFFPGSLWYLYEYTGEEFWKTAAMEYTGRIERIRHFAGHHDVGFMLNSSYGNGLRLAGIPVYQDVLLDGAKALSSRFSPQVGAIKSWDREGMTFPVIIDNMMNLELLVWASRKSGDPAFAEIATRHADKTLANHFRQDFSSFHVVNYNPETGAVEWKKTHQGAADGSAWARGQAWALYGFAMMARETGNPAYLEQARNIATFLIHHPRMPADKVPYWDFDAPNLPNEERDASSAAIMASALIGLSEYFPAGLEEEYLDFARQQLLTLASPIYRAPEGKNGDFLLGYSVGSKPHNSEVGVSLNYADYYFLEALLRYRARMVALAKIPPPPPPHSSEPPQ